MGKLVIILVFTLGVLLMLESAQAGNDCRSYGVQGYVYVIRMTGRHSNGYWYKVGASLDPKQRLRNLQTGNPYRLTLLGTFHVSDCKRAEEGIKNDPNLTLGRGDGGTEWYKITSPTEEEILKKIIQKHVKLYPTCTKESEAVVEDSDDDTTDSGHSHRRLQTLLTYLLN